MQSRLQKGDHLIESSRASCSVTLRICAGVLGVEEVQAGLSPEQKLAAIQTAQQQGGRSTGSSRGSGVIMVWNHLTSCCKAACVASATGLLHGNAYAVWKCLWALAALEGIAVLECLVRRVL